MEVLFQHLIGAFCLAVLFWVISQGKIKSHIKGKFQELEKLSQVMKSDGIYCWNKYSLFRELINDNQNHIKAR